TQYGKKSCYESAATYVFLQCAIRPLSVGKLHGNQRRPPKPPWKPPNPPRPPPNPLSCMLPQPRSRSALEDHPPSPPKSPPPTEPERPASDPPKRSLPSPSVCPLRPVKAFDFEAQLSWFAQELLSEK